jgi:hypothetical protein
VLDQQGRVISAEAAAAPYRGTGPGEAPKAGGPAAKDAILTRRGPAKTSDSEATATVGTMTPAPPAGSTSSTALAPSSGSSGACEGAALALRVGGAAGRAQEPQNGFLEWAIQ